MAKGWRRRSQFTKKKFQPYTKTLGEFALAWNEFHDSLGEFFLRAIRGDTRGLQGYFQLWNVWNCITNDRQKRIMLQAAIDAIEVKKKPRLQKLTLEVLWLVERGNSLETKRNNAIHSPLVEMRNALAVTVAQEVGDVVPGGGWGHARAEALSESIRKSGRSLLQEIRFYRDYAAALTVYAKQLDAVWDKQTALPERPPLPPLKDSG